jgi:phage FluMu protein gp41
MTAIVFDYIIPIRRKAVARKSDPQVSHDAAKRAELGKAEMQRRSIYVVLKINGPQTVRQIAGAIGYTVHDVGRRIVEIEGIAPNGEKRDGSRVWAVV